MYFFILYKILLFIVIYNDILFLGWRVFEMVLSYIILILSAFSFLLGVMYLKYYGKNKKCWNYFFTSLGSTIWGVGFGFLLVQSSDIGALICRGIGMIGVFMYAIFGVRLLTDMADTPAKLRKIAAVITYLGIILYPFVISPDRLEFYMGRFGMSYTFASDIWNTLYNLYNVVILLVFIIILVKMRKEAEHKRQKVMNSGLWLFFICFFAGTVLDTILPMVGVGAFPGSTLSQFFAVFIVYKYLIYKNENSLSFDNIFNHIHHSLEMPIMVFDFNRKFEFATDAFYTFFDKDKEECSDLKISDLFVLESEEDIYRVLGDDSTKECFTKDSNRYCSLLIEKVVDSYEDTIGFIILVNDLTDKYKFISELKEAKEKAEEAFRSKDIILANMSKGIGNSLGNIINLNEMIFKEENIESIREYSKQISEYSDNLLKIVENIDD